ncbi:1910_t:CDS:2 [Rhizophagus irregularis]|nr:1910_t:CDS:2 [Rhizophagus irregularis]
MSQITYINNKVLMARLEYRMKTSKNEESLSANYNIFTHQGIVGLVTLSQHLGNAQFAESSLGLTLKIGMASTHEYLSANPVLRNINGMHTYNESNTIAVDHKFNFNVLKDMKDQLFNFEAIEISDWKLNMEGPSIMDLLQQQVDVTKPNHIIVDQDRKKAIDNFINRPEAVPEPHFFETISVRTTKETVC